MSENISTLKEQLAEAADEKTYDALTKQIAAEQRTASVTAARDRQVVAAKAAAERAAAVAEYESDLAALAKLKADVVKDDEHLFADLVDLYEEFEVRYRAGLQVNELENELQAEARNLGLPEVPPEPLTICNLNVSKLRREAVLPFVFTQFGLAVGQIKDAKRNGQEGVPDRPGIDWFHKGDGRYWPRSEKPANQGVAFTPDRQPEPEVPAEQPAPAAGKVVVIEGEA